LTLSYLVGGVDRLMYTNCLAIKEIQYGNQ